MNGQENGLLHEISKKLDKLDDSIKETNEKVSSVREGVIRTEERIKNLYETTNDISSDIQRLHDRGCAHGRTEEATINQKIDNLQQETKDIKKDLDKKASKSEATKISGGMGAASGTILSTIIHALFTVFK